MGQLCFDAHALSTKYFSVADLEEAFSKVKEGDPTLWGLLTNGISFNCFGMPSEGWTLVEPIFLILEKAEQIVDENERDGNWMENVYVIPMMDVGRNVVLCTYAELVRDDEEEPKILNPREIAVPH